jgi:hypothetical protein
MSNIELPSDILDKMPVKISQNQMKKILKEMRKELKPELSEKQKAHIEKLKEKNKERLELYRQKKKEEADKIKKSNLILQPKRVYKQRAPKKEEYEEESETEVIEVVKPLGSKSHAIPSGWKKKKIIVKQEESDDEEEVYQKTKKATKIVETVNKLDKAINQIKTSNNRYDSLLSKFKF